MSFSQEVKAEITQNILRDCCKKAQLAAFIQLSSELYVEDDITKLQIRTENANSAKRVYLLIKEVYSLKTELEVTKKTQLRKNNVYLIKVIENPNIIIDDLKEASETELIVPKEQIVKDECCARAYLAGAFLARGSINSPTTPNYHLEIITDSLEQANFINKLMHRFTLPTKLTKRRNKTIVYLKQSEKISDFLRLIGTSNAVFAFEDQRIQRDFRNNFTRLDNCELANEMKIQKTGKAQIEDIEVIQSSGRYEMLDERLKEVAKLRLKHPEHSLNELCEEYERATGNKISKSGMKHRLAKIKHEANLIREE